MVKMSKSPEEIKKGLECCSKTDKCPVCPYYGEDWCSTEKNANALAYIQQLEAQVPKWISAKEPPQEWRNDDRTLINYLVYLPEYGVDVGNYLGQAETWYIKLFS